MRFSMSLSSPGSYPIQNRSSVGTNPLFEFILYKSQGIFFLEEISYIHHSFDLNRGALVYL